MSSPHSMFVLTGLPPVVESPPPPPPKRARRAVVADDPLPPPVPIEEPPVPEAEPPPPVKKKPGPKPGHLRIVDQIVTNLLGSRLVLDDITELDSSITPAEAVRLKHDLRIAITALNRVNTMIKERSKHDQ